MKFVDQTFQEAISYLSNSDPILSKIISNVGECKLNRREDYFQSLVGAVINQQLSGSAADAIYQRLLSQLRGRLTPTEVLNLKEVQFRSIGLSKAKEQFIKGIALKFQEDKSFLTDIEGLSDSDVLQKLTEIKGIGKWTAEMFMIFSLNRLDILPIGDAGFRRGISVYYIRNRKPDELDISEIADKWRPFRTIAVWYIWRALDNQPKGPLQK